MPSCHETEDGAGQSDVHAAVSVIQVSITSHGMKNVSFQNKSVRHSQPVSLCSYCVSALKFGPHHGRTVLITAIHKKISNTYAIGQRQFHIRESQARGSYMPIWSWHCALECHERLFLQVHSAMGICHRCLSPS